MGSSGEGHWLWFAIDVVFVAFLAAAMVYGLYMWRRRPRDRSMDATRDRATRNLYREADKRSGK